MMSERILTVMSVLMLAASAAAAQPPPPGPVGMALGLQRNYAQMKNNITSSAEKMPEADYFFKPTPDIRGYGQLWAHVADAQFGQCSGAKGVPNPRQGQPSFGDGSRRRRKRGRPSLIRTRSASTMPSPSLTDASASLKRLEWPRRPAVACAVAPLWGVIGHGSEMYGIGTVYLRLKGQIPRRPPNSSCAAAALPAAAAAATGAGGNCPGVVRTFRSACSGQA